MRVTFPTFAPPLTVVALLACCFLLPACGGQQSTLDALHKCNDDYRLLAEKMSDRAAPAPTPCPTCPEPVAAPAGAAVGMTRTDFDGLVRDVTQAGFKVIDRQEKYLVVDYEGLKARLYSQGTNAQLYAAFVGANPSMDAINEWNRTKRFSRAYVDTDGDPVIESDLDLEGGITEGAIVEWVRTFNLSVRAFAKMLVDTEKRSTL